MNFNVELTPNSVAKIGKEHQKTNNITLNVTGAGNDLVKIRITVGCTGKVSDLLTTRHDFITVTCKHANDKEVMTGKPSADKIEWVTNTFGINLPATISLENFISETQPGTAEVQVQIYKVDNDNDDDNVTDRNLFEKTLKISKVLEKKDEPSIRYFVVTPSYILHAGQTEIMISFLATGFKKIVLFRNNEALQSWSCVNDTITDKIKDTPSFTSIYRLQSFTDDGQESTISFERTVQVISSGWNRISLPLGSPIRLFVAYDFQGSGTERLYGIFKNDEDKYILYSSATGVDNWRKEIGEIPPQMATSPGVVYNNKLWLIGGSSVDYDNCSNESWSFGMDGWKQSEGEPLWPERMGHSCIVFSRMVGEEDKKEIWLFGGYNNKTSEALNDLWIGNEVDGNMEWIQCENNSKGNKWPPSRLNHAAVTVRDWKGNAQAWVYGGAPEPQTTKNFDDLWTTKNGKDWEQINVENSGSPILPSPGNPLGSALVAFPTDVSSEIADRLLLLGSFQEWATDDTGKKLLGNRISSFIFEWQWGHQYWELRPVFEGWQQFHGDNFYMQALVFNRFLFVWSLPPEIVTPLKLNILVPL
jgi:hypothetical protein